MKLSSVTIAGFRGIRTRIDVPFGSGFTVICGRNGTGKSTICDAVEFAIRGGISKQEDKKESGESIRDYLWWRGKTKVEKQYVQLVVASGPQRQNIDLLRTPDILTWIELDDKIIDLVCDRSTMPPHALSKLCATSIIRDEDIARLSMDLSETQRFAYVREALAGEESTSIHDRLSKALAALDAQIAKLAVELETADREIAEQLARSAELRGKIADAQSLGDAEATLRRLLLMQREALSEVLFAGERRVAIDRQQLAEVESIVADLKGLRARLPGAHLHEVQAQLNELGTSISSSEDRRKHLEERLAALNVDLERAEAQGPYYAALAELLQAGTRLGLINEACPLCGTRITEAHLREHIANGTKQLDEIGKKAADLSVQRNALQRELDALKLELARKRGDSAARTEALRLWEANKALIEKKAAALGLQFDVTGNATDEYLLQEIAKRRDLVDRLEKLLATVKSRDLSREIEAIDADVVRRKAARTERDKAVFLLRSASTKGWQAEADIRRETNRLIDEQLALLSPLTRELYSRLRPHVVWRDLNFYVRGELRKFLGMRVGDDLNPAFMFSSGQRRAAGMAFLLSLYLARSWCHLRTIVLDDPVQHIDDYRALHMAELLAAFCRSGHQVICTVEDPALADLLCRRLRSDEGLTGVRIDMEYSAEDGVRIGSIREQVPPPRQVLLPA
jgi:chromosome segregation ATPase